MTVTAPTKVFADRIGRIEVSATMAVAAEAAKLRAQGVKPGFLVSPSVDGEFGAMVIRRMGGEVIRGSSSHTGARTLRDFY